MSALGGVVKGVANDLGPQRLSSPAERTVSGREVLTEIQDELVNVAGDVVASGMLVNDIDEALHELVAEGMVAGKEVETADGTVTYYRLNTNEALG